MKRTAEFGGRHFVLRWEQGRGHSIISEVRLAIVITGLEAWGKKAVAISQMGELAATLYEGDAFSTEHAVIVPETTEGACLPFMLVAVLMSTVRDVRRIDQSIKITNRHSVKVPFDLRVGIRSQLGNTPTGCRSPIPTDPTQWIFHGHPCGSVIWDDGEQVDRPRPAAHRRTVLQSPLLACSVTAGRPKTTRTWSWLKNSANGSRRRRRFYPFEDDDGIVCIPSLRGERPAHERLLQLLHAAYGDDWYDGILTKLLAGSCSAIPRRLAPQSILR